MTRNKDFYQTFFRLVALIALQNLIVLGVSLADNMMLGAFSQDALTGAALANQVQFILQMVVAAAAEGVVLFCSQYWGKHKANGDGQQELHAMRNVISIGLAVGVAVALLFFVAVSFYAQPILRLFTDDLAVVAQGERYLRIIRFSYLFFALTQVCIAALRSVGVVRLGTIISLSTLVVNVGLNYLLIFGKLGFPRLGAEGAALATLAARVIELFIAAGFLLLRDKRIGYRLAQFRLEPELFKRFVAAALPLVLSGGTWGIAMAVHTAILGHLGSDTIAAASIANTIFQMITVLAGGSASAAAVMTAKSVGAGEPLAQIRKNTNSFQLLFLCIGLANGALLYALKDVILQYYQLEPATVALAGQFITVLSITCIGTAYQMPCLTGVVRGGGDTKFVFYNDTIFCWFVVIPMALAAAYWLHLPPVWVFFCLKGDQIWKCFVAVVKVNRYRWIKVLAK